MDSEWPAMLKPHILIRPASDGRHRPASHPLQRVQTPAEVVAPPEPAPDPPEPDELYSAALERQRAEWRDRHDRWDGDRRERWNAYMRQYRLEHPDYVARMRDLDRDRQRRLRHDGDRPTAATGAGE